MGEFQRKKDIIKRLIQQPIKKRNRDESEQLRRIYAECMNKMPLQKHMVLYESYHGRGMLGNPYALFLEFRNREDFSSYTHIWALETLDETKTCRLLYASQENVIFVKRDSQEYIKALASAKYLINNVTFPAYYTKREGQIYINTWHGIPIKSLGYKMKNGAYENGNIMRNFFACDYLISPCDYMTKVYKESYLLEGIFPNTVIEDGMPRNDLYYKTDKDKLKDYMRMLGVNVEEEKKIILYAPTYRDEYKKAKDRTREYVSFYEELMGKIDGTCYQLFIKPHQTEYQRLQYVKALEGKILPIQIDANELLTITDILVTDYSSIFFDYLITERPILFYIPDLEMYRDKRGMEFPLEELPGPVTSRIEDLITYIASIDKIQERYKFQLLQMKNRYLRYDDGMVSKRILNKVLDNKELPRILPKWNQKIKLLFYIGVIRTNGVTVSLMSLLELLDLKKYDVTVYFIKGKKSVFDVEHFRKGVRLVERVGTYCATTTEEFFHELVDQFGLTKRMSASHYPDRLYHREYKRCFGDVKFDYVIDFSGYGSFIPRVLLAADGAKKLIWQHNNLPKDRMRVVNGMRPFETELKVVFSLYKKFDKVVGCSKKVMEINREELATKETYEKFAYVNNSVYARRVLAGKEKKDFLVEDEGKYLILEEEQDVGNTEIGKMIPVPDETCVNFCTIGRMSVEKNQKNLLEAFYKLHRENEHSRLYVVGDGPLRESLRKYVKKKGIDDAVIFTGNIENPFALLSMCDCFLLPSKWEGQALSVLEARLLGLPIIVSDYPGYEAVCVENGQYVTKMDSDAICESMIKFIKGEVMTASWDYKAYNQEVVRQFEALLD